MNLIKNRIELQVALAMLSFLGLMLTGILSVSSAFATSQDDCTDVHTDQDIAMCFGVYSVDQ